ncbi:hypothetical protein PXW65_06230 [Klebsiella quasipneumoniae subsp. similipneumoniae]|uniref:hypothetical protein n=1 Tax=Klebsiella quasipneumoniae TaxID=1463165 RepID=UPI00238053A0|nr:hypothetical protein [Klebsiella quasipneumoniae]MDE4793637.1 hypothetical protein [Klebsiella quasipneumoniae subsp. similipneumoniae]
MTNNQLTDEQIAQLLGDACMVIGDRFATVDELSAAKAIRALAVELQERRKADSEPVAEVVSIYGDPEAFVEREIRPLVGIQQMPYRTKLYRHAQPAPEKYNIGDATMRHIFTPTGMTNVSDMQAVFDRVEAVLVGMEQPAPVVPDGYVMVPKEPTADMIAAAMNCEDVLFNSDDSFCVQFGKIYEDMLAAAPQEVGDA